MISELEKLREELMAKLAAIDVLIGPKMGENSSLWLTKERSIVKITGIEVGNGSQESTPKRPASPRIKEKPVLATLPPKTIPEASKPIPEVGKYLKKLVPCEVLHCDKKTSPDRKRCPSCNSLACPKCLRGVVCKNCRAAGES